MFHSPCRDFQQTFFVGLKFCQYFTGRIHTQSFLKVLMFDSICIFVVFEVVPYIFPNLNVIAHLVAPADWLKKFPQVSEIGWNYQPFIHSQACVNRNLSRSGLLVNLSFPPKALVIALYHQLTTSGLMEISFCLTKVDETGLNWSYLITLFSPLHNKNLSFIAKYPTIS